MGSKVFRALPAVFLRVFKKGLEFETPKKSKRLQWTTVLPITDQFLMRPSERTAQYAHGRPKQRLRGSKSHHSRVPLGVHCSRHHPCWSKLSGHGSSRHHSSRIRGQSNSRHHGDAARRCLPNASRSHRCRSKSYPGSKHGNSSSPSRFHELAPAVNASQPAIIKITLTMMR